MTMNARNFDLIFRNGLIVDGTGASGFRADLGLAHGRIAAIGDLSEAQAEQILDVTGRVIAPGFIDIHTHADIALLARPDHLPKITQGVTTEVFSNCGLGFAPATPEALGIQKEYLLGLFGRDDGVPWNWESVAGFLSLYEGKIAPNIAYLIPHGSVRVSLLGMQGRAASREEVAAMAAMVRQGMDDGAWGLSTGLWYSPMSYADAHETTEICRAAASRGGFYAVHMRDYGAGILGSLDECAEISLHSSAPLQVSHLQIGGAANWGRAPEVLAHIERKRADGVELTFDAYPYSAGSTLVQAMLPAWATEGGPARLMQRLHDPADLERIVDAMNAADRDWTCHTLCGATGRRFAPYDGLSFAEIARREETPIGRLVTGILIEEELQACFIAHHGDPGDLRLIMAHPAMMIGSDGLHLPGKTHPRLYGAFPRLIARFVREEKLLSLEEAIWKMTGYPARRMGFRDRGRLSPGLEADIVVFDPETIADRATFEDPLQTAEGIDHVLVNGVPVLWNGEPVGTMPGRVLRPA